MSSLLVEHLKSIFQLSNSHVAIAFYCTSSGYRNTHMCIGKTKLLRSGTLVNVNQPAAKIAVDLSRSTVPQLFEGLHLADLRAM